MPAYLIGDLEIFDLPSIEDYRSKALPLVEKFRGRALALDAAPLALEGAWTSTNIVLLEFPDRAAIEALFAAPEYAPLARQRQAASRSSMMAISGL